MFSDQRLSRVRRRLAPAALAAAVLLAGCTGSVSGSTTEPAVTETSVTESSATESTGESSATASLESSPSEAGASGAGPSASVDASAAQETSSEPIALGAVGGLTSDTVHDIVVEFDLADFDTMVAAYTDTGDKDWITATVTIDGTSYSDVGLRLKGNSSLRGVSATDDPATIPWLVKLDKFVDDQHHDGLTEFVIRSSSSSTSLNEAVALELLDLAGLASQDAIAVRFSVNGGDPVLRLAIEHPDQAWMAEWFSANGALYKAESTGDWSSRGDDPESYDDVFDQEAGDDNADLTPLTEFLQFVAESDDTTFAAELSDWLDVESFATYLAMQDLLDNFDDIDGPGNNAYLYWDTEAERFTVVPWDYNLAFGQRPGFDGAPGGFELPSGDFPTPPEGVSAMPVPGEPRQPGGPGGEIGGFGGMQRANPLVDRFLANEEWADAYEQAKLDLRQALFDSGTADQVLAQWASIMTASGLVDDATVEAESAAITDYL